MLRRLRLRYALCLNMDAAPRQALRLTDAHQQMPPDRRNSLCIAKVRTAVEVLQLCLEPMQQIRV
ncbi:MAG TPA: hypothetical protein VK574_00145 [Terracidiphilus sp.]|nr:hypothetical protein [Terracidiphilus sp.]